MTSKSVTGDPRSVAAGSSPAGVASWAASVEGAPSGFETPAGAVLGWGRSSDSVDAGGGAVGGAEGAGRSCATAAALKSSEPPTMSNRRKRTTPRDVGAGRRTVFG